MTSSALPHRAGSALVAIALLAISPTVASAHRVELELCQGIHATIVGTPGDDVLRGTAGPDVMAGLGGNDALLGADGDDLICGGEGADFIRGGPGNDRLYGDTNRVEEAIFMDGSLQHVAIGDRLVPGPGDDVIDLGWDPAIPTATNTDRLDTVSFLGSRRGVVVRLADAGTWGTVRGQGSDTILAHARMVVIGSAHDDVLRGSEADEVLIGKGGKDKLISGGGHDRLIQD